jgi:hypothetical protein
VFKLEHEYIRSIALVADLHTMSRYGLCPKNLLGKEGGDLSASINAGQRQLLESWENYIKTAREDFNIDTVFVVGDAIAGINPKECGLMMMTTDLDEQTEAAIKLLEPLCKNKQVYTWSGTAYHESRDFRVHKVIAESLGGKFMSGVSNIQLEPSSKVVNVAHRTTEAVVYPESALSRDIMFLKEAEALGKLVKTHAVIRAHRHSYVEIHKHDLHYISLPCWQAFVPYDAALQWYFKYQPDIGGAIMLVDAKERLRFMHFLYPAPHIADKVVKG